MASSQQMVSAYLESVIEQLTGVDKAVPDHEGDYAVEVGGARFWARVAEGVAAEATLEDRLTRGIVIGADMIQRSPIMANLAEDEVAELSTALRPSEPLVHEVIRSYLVELLEREDRAGRLRPGTDLHEAADYLARMLLSALSAPVGRDLTDEAAVRELVRTQFVGGIVVAG
jgi:AcrR family transcriptional regulator